MGVDWFTCPCCEEVYNDCGDYSTCDLCGDKCGCINCEMDGNFNYEYEENIYHLCSYCMPQKRIKKVRYIDNPNYKKEVAVTNATIKRMLERTGEYTEYENSENENT